MTIAPVARLLNLHAGTRTLPKLILVTDERRLPDPMAAAADLPAGSGVILRHYGVPEREALAHDLARFCRRRRLMFFLAGDLRLALRSHAHGLHLSEPALAAGAELRRRRGKRLVLTVSAHSLPAVIRAARRGADAVLLGPVFATQSHPGRRPLGPFRFGLIARKSPIPVYALGGITGKNAGRLIGTGAAGIAALGALGAAVVRRNGVPV